MAKKSEENQFEKSPRITVTKQYKRDGDEVVTEHRTDGEEITDEEQIEVFRFQTEPAHVTAKYGMTINLGNYESARCDVSVTLPCHVEEIADAFTLAWQVAKSQLRAQTKRIKGGK